MPLKVTLTETQQRLIAESFNKRIIQKIKGSIVKAVKITRDKTDEMPVQFLEISEEHAGIWNALVDKLNARLNLLEQRIDQRIQEEGAGRARVIKKEEQEAFKKFMQENFGKFGLGAKFSGPESVKTLIDIGNQLKPGSLAQMRQIRSIMGFTKDDYQIGHKNASGVTLHIDTLLSVHRAVFTEEQIRDLEKIKALSLLVDRLDNNYFQKKGIPSKATTEVTMDILNELIRGAGNKLEVNLNEAANIQASIATGTLSHQLIVELEVTDQNQFKGKLSQTIANAFLAPLLKEIEETGKVESEIFNKLDPFTVASSPTIVQNVADILTSVILGRKSNVRSKSAKPKKAFSSNLGIKARKFKNKKLKKVPTNQKLNRIRQKLLKLEPDREDLNIFGVQALINEVLALKVEEQMGKASDPPIKLRYQTGRFADSAKLLTLTRTEAGVLAGTYTYQRNPYDVFLPNGRLGTPQRDPRLYIEGAIREAAISILKRRFPGIVLELQ